jgi:protocatechuate 3,4-dioxygenase beta subunit
VTIADATIKQAQGQAQGLLPLTPSVIEGPYFRIGAPQRDSLIEEGITGDRLQLSGRVLTPEGRPIPGAVLNFWMSDDEGNYDMVGYRLHGYIFADEQGRYQMEMIVPACYEPRHAKHIHVKVQGISRPLTTQLYFTDDEERLKDNWYLPELDVQISEGADGRKHGAFDFVIQQVTEQENVTAASLAARVK